MRQKSIMQCCINWVWLVVWHMNSISKYNFLCLSFFLSFTVSHHASPLFQTVNQRVWKPTRSRQHSSHTPRWQRLDVGLSHITSFSQRKSWQCGKRTLRALVTSRDTKAESKCPDLSKLTDWQACWQVVQNNQELSISAVHEVSNFDLAADFTGVYFIDALM